MDAARWCFVLICHTLLTEGEERELERENKQKEKQKGFLITDCKVSTLLPRTGFYCLSLALLVLHHLLHLCLFLSEWL